MTVLTTTQRSFLVPFSAFVLVCAALMALVFRTLHLPLNAVYIGALAYFTLLTLALHSWQERALGTDPKRFVHRFMAGLVIKMMVSLVLLVILLLTLPKPTLIPFVITFVVLYLAFLTFSTARSLKLMRTIHRP
jgi:F0F1-type ATP synthase assembly protein I